MRAWAIEEAMAIEEDQFITDDTVAEISKVFTPEDDLSLAVHVTRTTNGDIYLEYPFVPMNTLVTRDLEIELTYWAMEPDPRRAGGHSDHHGVRFGFWVQGSGVEFVSVSWGKIVAQKFERLMRALSDTYPIVILGQEGHTNAENEITVNGDVKAKFFKTGMAHDVRLTCKLDSPLRAPKRNDGPIDAPRISGIGV